MTAVLLVFAALFGLVVGSWLNVVSHPVPAPVSLTRVNRSPAGDAPISLRYLIVQAFTVLAFLGVTWWMLTLGPDMTSAVFWVVLIAYLFFASISIVLTLIDIDVHRLPNSIVLPAYLVGGLLFTLACMLGASWSRLLTAVVGMALLYAFYFTVRLVSPRGMGGGDVKLAGVIGLFLGFAGWAALAVGAFAAFVFGGVFGLILIATRRAGRKTAIPFGPWMILGAWAGLVGGEPLSLWYLGLAS